MSAVEEDRNGEPRRARNNGRKNPLQGRGTALFAQRRNHRAPPPRKQEFFTESTNTSFIPSPSPTRASAFARPRQALGDGAGGKPFDGRSRALTKNKENEPLQSTSVVDQRSQSQASSSKRSPIHISAAGSPQPSTRAPQSNRSAARTPSPPRGRGEEERPPLVSPASFYSESSEPPQALPEIYRRIEDEELIAGAGSDVSSSAKGSPRNSKIIKRLSSSPAGVRSNSVRRVSPQLQAQEAEVKGGNTNIPSPKAPSPKSSTTSSFEDTVQTDPEMLARDERRVKDAIASNQPIFAKARKGRASLTLENLRRQDASQESKSSSEAATAPSERSSGIPVNVPSGWGGKARKDKRWLENIAKARQAVPADTSNVYANGANVSTEPDKASRNVSDWLKEAAAVPTADVEEPVRDLDDTAPMQPLRERTSFDKARKWESERQKDSLSPRSSAALAALRERSIERLEQKAVTTNRLDGLGEKMTVKFTKKPFNRSDTIGAGLAPSAENGFAEPEASVRHDSEVENGFNFDAPKETNVDTNGPSIPLPQLIQPGGPLSADAAKQLAFAAASQPKSTADSRDLLRRLARASSSSPAGLRQTSQGLSSQSDEGERRRASPLSLGDQRTEVKAKSEIYPNQRVPISFTAPLDNSGGMPGAEAAGKPTVAESVDSTKTKQNCTGVEKLNPDSSEQDPSEHKPVPETPLVDGKGVYLKTPKVTGGWIDTPIATAKRLGMAPEDISDPAEEYDEQNLLDAAKIVLGADKAQRVGPRLQQKSRRDLDQLAKTAPELPGSALAAIIDHAKRKNRGLEGPEGDETLQLDESTIQSLEQLLVNDEDRQVIDKAGRSSSADKTSKDEPTENKAGKSSSRPGKEPAVEVKIESQPSISKDSTKTTTDQAAAATSRFSQFMSRVRGTDTAQQGGKRSTSDTLPGKAGSKPALTVTIDDSPKQARSKKPKKSVAVIAPEESCDQAGEFHDFIWPCEACRKRAKAPINVEDEKIGVVQWQTIHIPCFWYFKKTSRIPRLTRLGWLIMTITVCWLAEMIVADAYTPPFYAETMVGYGVDYNMVRPPFVIPKLVWRSLAGDVVRWVWSILYGVVSFVLGVFGFDLDEITTPAPTSSTVRPWTEPVEPWWPPYMQEGRINRWGATY